MRFADVDAVTLDAFGTIVTLRDPAPALERLTGRSEDEIRRAFAAEVAFYLQHAVEGRDAATLQRLRERCTETFNRALGTNLSPEQFLSALEYEELPHVRESLRALEARGVTLAVVANWDCALPGHLERLGLARSFSAIVTSAEAGAAKPDPAPFRIALERLGVPPERALHIGDGEVDEAGAAAAGLHFAPAPVDAAVAALT
jgi:HAD superfamily hydrolase (TIGR01509 family)